ncbi:vesicle transport protein [Anaeramoeba flamelloides]|uniref:Vesicle transport protein n=1 Tax=Anaeramoeba flamelloides TaxID=1746091 RepID=A0AAV7YAN6_9EUKA|nr:vesicle transport through interaction with t-snares [Anaeramoeba flamelloides]KAJ3426848.1 vesicle transport through interaction with t-snares [Anaeramoeba flamelloides]KAJ6227853.1 vesicle transport protein [Anaeramoeba flamelloides]KAJ6243268.1 vesicle transport protein [Anaeramoeba flamelloides]|eukprot:Anaeramoba_flamelloidesa339196_94.p1 GENE.a339196_94~~a339196_94.p1  ORF type:complete len:234 (+),score=56.59 a339196_94:55-756(+)
MESTEIFDNLEEEYASLCLSIRDKTSQIPDFSGEQRKSYIRATERDLEEVYEILQQMEVEVRSLSSGVREKCKNKLLEYKSEYQKLRNELRKATSSFPNEDEDRLKLFAGREDLITNSKDSREELINTKEKLNNSTNLLKSGHSKALEVEEIAVGVLDDLHGQRKTIENTKNNLNQADSNIDQNSRLLSIMLRRKITNKIILVLVILFLLGAIILVIYFSYFRKKSSDSGSDK